MSGPAPNAARAARLARAKPPELPVVLEHLERRLKEKAHTRAELVGWLDGPHAWCEWDEGSLSTHLFETRSGTRPALDAFRDANPSVDVELRPDGVELFTFRLNYSFRSKKGLEAAIRSRRAGMLSVDLIAHMESEYKSIKQDIDALLREKRIFAIEDDRQGGKRGKILFACIERGEVEPLFDDRESRNAYHEIPVPEHAKVLVELQTSETFKLPEDVYRRRLRVGLGAMAPPAQAVGRKRARIRNATNSASLLGTS